MTSNMFIFVRFHTRPGNEAALKDALQEVLVPTRHESGCISIHSFQSHYDPQLFFIHSRWEDAAAFKLHRGLPHTQKFVGRVVPLIDHPFDLTRTEQIG